jgi:heparosan-N-sulfate-glucuronate 5-epimerase
VKRLAYYQRIFSAYLLRGNSQLSFWHDVPEANPQARPDRLGEYYMSFAQKADYAGPFDSSGVPLLDYRGQIGMQYNPIAIAQYGLGNYNLLKCDPNAEIRRQRFLDASHWLVSNLEQNARGVWVWNHKFDWEYRDTLKAPWYSGLAQGQGISLLVRAHQETEEAKYLDAAQRAFLSLLRCTEEGGVLFTDAQGDAWIEEYLVDPPTHILNGMIWASWGVHDYFLATGDPQARQLFERVVRTLVNNLAIYDLGFWSLYEQSGTRLKMIASPFYHRLHIVQLRILHRMTGQSAFHEYADRWQFYAQSRARRIAALCYKSAFKLCYY